MKNYLQNLDPMYQSMIDINAIIPGEECNNSPFG